MFDFAWSEIALIAAVALIAIGPKDMPAAIRAITGMIKKARRMAAEFQTHVDEMVREANLDEVRNQINEIRNFDIKGAVERAVDSDGSLRSTFASNPLTPTQTVDPLPEVTIAEPAQAVEPEPELLAVESDAPAAPAFIPPNLVPKPAPKPVAKAASDPPAFIPPAVVLQHRSSPPA